MFASVTFGRGQCAVCAIATGAAVGISNPTKRGVCSMATKPNVESAPKAARGLPHFGFLAHLPIQDSTHSQRGLFDLTDRGVGQCHRSAQKALLSKRYQALGVAARIRRLDKHHIIAGHFALDRQPVVDPPYCRMKKQYRPNYFLQQVSPVVPAIDMGALVKNRCAQFLVRQVSQCPFGKDIRRAKEPNRRGYADPTGNIDCCGAGAAKI